MSSHVPCCPCLQSPAASTNTRCSIVQTALPPPSPSPRAISYPTSLHISLPTSQPIQPFSYAHTTCIPNRLSNRLSVMIPCSHSITFQTDVHTIVGSVLLPGSWSSHQPDAVYLCCWYAWSAPYACMLVFLVWPTCLQRVPPRFTIPWTRLLQRQIQLGFLLAIILGLHLHGSIHLEQALRDSAGAASCK